MDAGTSEPFKLIPMVTAAAFEFNATHGNNKGYTTTAADHAGDFILWARGVGAGRVIATRLAFNPNDADLECFKNEHHQSCIIQPRKTSRVVCPQLPPEKMQTQLCWLF